MYLRAHSKGCLYARQRSTKKKTFFPFVRLTSSQLCPCGGVPAEDRVSSGLSILSNVPLQ